MTTIAEMYRRFASVDLRNQVPVIAEEQSDILAELNKDQLYRGIDSKGEKLSPYKSPAYARYKNTLNSRPGNGVPDLRLTGAFYKGWVVKVSKTEMNFDSLDSKTPDLIAKYGTDIFGLTTESKTTYSFGAFYEGVKKYITEKTKIQFR